jgi:dihydroorotase
VGVLLWPIAAISKGLQGKEISEFYDLKSAGAVLFSDDMHPLVNAQLLKVALQYSLTTDVLLSIHPIDADLKLHAHVNESLNTLKLGMQGVSPLVETIALQKLIHLLEYTGAPLHIDAISCAQSASLIRKAKKEGLPVTCSVNVANLIWNDNALSDFDNRFKLWPPLRNETDRRTLIEAVLEGTIDAVCSDHRPHTAETLDCEFEAAPYGANQIQTVYSALKTYVPDFDDAALCRALYYGPLKCLRLQPKPIEHSAHIPLVIYHPNEQWILNSASNSSLSANSPFWGEALKGVTKYLYLNGEIVEPV